MDKANYKKLYEKYKETMRAASKRYKAEHKKQISEYNHQYYEKITKVKRKAIKTALEQKDNK